MKAKGVHDDIIDDVRKASLFCYIVTLSQCESSDNNIDAIYKCEDDVYGRMLSNYINNKNINDIQLIKKEYGSMADDSKIEIAEFEDFESVSNPEDLLLIREFIENPDLEENKEKITRFFANMNVEINADDLANAMPKYKKLLNFKMGV